MMKVRAFGMIFLIGIVPQLWASDSAPKNCIDLSGEYVGHGEEDDFLTVKQDGCKSVNLHIYFGSQNSKSNCERQLTTDGKPHTTEDACMAAADCRSGKCTLTARFVDQKLELTWASNKSQPNPYVENYRLDDSGDLSISRPQNYPPIIWTRQ